MNIYTKNVFVSNLTFHAGNINKELINVSSGFKVKSKKVIALMSFYKGIESEVLMINGENRDLIKLRTEIALYGYKLKLLDVFGKGWPSNIALENSRDGNWADRKKQLMCSYNFNLCFENTAAYNYMTEKIWDSIENGCLPIYYGIHTNAYDLFPERSFIDYSLFNSPKELFDYLAKMTDEEFVERMNRCIETYNSIVKKGEGFVISERKKMLKNIVDEIYSIHNN